MMLFLQEKSETRHANLCKLITSRGTLTLSLTDLEQEALQRSVIDTKPIQSLYSLTPKGTAIAKQLKKSNKSCKAQITSKSNRPRPYHVVAFTPYWSARSLQSSTVMSRRSSVALAILGSKA
jgi:DNA-binding HxlR family transcriptional regulator